MIGKVVGRGGVAKERRSSDDVTRAENSARNGFTRI